MSRHKEETLIEVLSILRRSSRPLSAYDVLGEMREAQQKNVAPPTVYRALAALSDRGQVHRLESLNAYIACQCTRHQQSSIMSICDDCGSVEESIAPSLLEDISNVAGKSGFAPERHMIEIHGVCASCSDGRTPA